MNATFRNWMLGVVAAVVISCTGCQPSARSVVVDLDAVAKATGRDEGISRAVEAATQQLNAQLVQAARDMEDEIKQLQNKIGAAPNAEQQAELQRVRAQVQQNIQNNKLIAENARNRVRAEQILLFRSEVKPIAAEIARKHHAEIVLIDNENVVWHASGADITGEVIGQLRARPPTPAPVAPAQAPSRGTNEAATTNNAAARE